MIVGSVWADALILLIWPALWLLAAIPVFVIGRRLGVVHYGEAFIPMVGPSIVLLHSIRRTGWLSVLTLIPYANLGFFIWLTCRIPGGHGRTRWWILPFLIPLVNVVAFFVYAFTTRQESVPYQTVLAV